MVVPFIFHAFGLGVIAQGDLGHIGVDFCAARPERKQDDGDKEYEHRQQDPAVGKFAQEGIGLHIGLLNGWRLV
jgi:hypothetical protein